MHALRRSVLLGRLVLAWFALALGAAIAAPMMQPQSMVLICSAMGEVKLVVLDQNGDQHDAGHHAIQCPMCLAMALPPTPQSPLAEPPYPLAHACQSIAAAHIAALVGAPLPPRGPPALV